MGVNTLVDSFIEQWAAVGMLLSVVSSLVYAKLAISLQDQ